MFFFLVPSYQTKWRTVAHRANVVRPRFFTVAWTDEWFEYELFTKIHKRWYAWFLFRFKIFFKKNQKIIVEEIESQPESSRTNDLEQFDNLFKLCYCLWNTLIEETWFSIDNESDVLQCNFSFLSLLCFFFLFIFDRLAVGYRGKTQRHFIPEIDRQAAVRVNGGVLFHASLKSHVINSCSIVVSFNIVYLFF